MCVLLCTWIILVPQFVKANFFLAISGCAFLQFIPKFPERTSFYIIAAYDSFFSTLACAYINTRVYRGKVRCVILYGGLIYMYAFVACKCFLFFFVQAECD